MRRFIRKKDRDKRVPLLPNLITTMSLFLGSYAILYSLRGNFEKAAIFIIFASFMDALDGRIARATNTTSLFGKEYDSLSDAIAFGVAPAIMAYLWQTSIYGRFGWLASFLFIACGALRLARFNTIQSDGSTFVGLPIPAAALALAGTVFAQKIIGTIPSALVLGEVYLLSYLMVSPIKYPSFKKVTYVRAHPFQLLVAGVLFLVVAAAFPEVVLVVVITTFVLTGPVLGLMRMMGIYKVKEEHSNEKIIKENPHF